MTSEYVWRELRDHAVNLFGDTPGAALEERILVVFRSHPHIVALGIDHVHERKKAGLVTSPWGLLAAHVEKATAPLEDVTVTDERDRDKAVRRAEQWIRAAGKHYDRLDELLDELFGPHGRLRAFDSPDLRQRIARAWRDARPEGQLIDEQAEQRARAHIALCGQQPGAEGRPVTRPPWKLPARTTTAAVDDPEPVAADPEPEPA